MQVCRICLVTDGKLYPMTEFKFLYVAYETLTGLLVETDVNISPCLCNDCANQLLNYALFRIRSVQAHSILLEPIRDKDFKTLDSTKTNKEFQNQLASVFESNKNGQFDLNIEFIEKFKNLLTNEKKHAKILHDFLKNSSNGGIKMRSNSSASVSGPRGHKGIVNESNKTDSNHINKLAELPKNFAVHSIETGNDDVHQNSVAEESCNAVDIYGSSFHQVIVIDKIKTANNSIHELSSLCKDVVDGAELVNDGRLQQDFIAKKVTNNNILVEKYMSQEEIVGEDFNSGNNNMNQSTGFCENPVHDFKDSVNDSEVHQDIMEEAATDIFKDGKCKSHADIHNGYVIRQNDNINKLPGMCRDSAFNSTKLVNDVEVQRDFDLEIASNTIFVKKYTSQIEVLVKKIKTQTDNMNQSLGFEYFAFDSIDLNSDSEVDQEEVAGDIIVDGRYKLHEEMLIDPVKSEKKYTNQLRDLREDAVVDGTELENNIEVRQDAVTEEVTSNSVTADSYKLHEEIVIDHANNESNRFYATEVVNGGEVQHDFVTEEPTSNNITVEKCRSQVEVCVNNIKIEIDNMKQSPGFIKNSAIDCIDLASDSEIDEDIIAEKVACENYMDGRYRLHDEIVMDIVESEKDNTNQLRGLREDSVVESTKLAHNGELQQDFASEVVTSNTITVNKLISQEVGYVNNRKIENDNMNRSHGLLENSSIDCIDLVSDSDVDQDIVAEGFASNIIMDDRYKLHEEILIDSVRRKKDHTNQLRDVHEDFLVDGTQLQNDDKGRQHTVIKKVASHTIPADSSRPNEEIVTAHVNSESNSLKQLHGSCKDSLLNSFKLEVDGEIIHFITEDIGNNIINVCRYSSPEEDLVDCVETENENFNKIRDLWDESGNDVELINGSKDHDSIVKKAVNSNVIILGRYKPRQENLVHPVNTKNVSCNRLDRLCEDSVVDGTEQGNDSEVQRKIVKKEAAASRVNVVGSIWNEGTVCDQVRTEKDDVDENSVNESSIVDANDHKPDIDGADYSSKDRLPGQARRKKMKTPGEVNVVTHKKLKQDDELLINNKLSCDICHYETISVVQLLAHMKAHAATKSFSCDVCSYKTIHRHSLQKHIRIHSGERPYKCNDCKKGFTNKSSLQTHMLIHSAARLFTCDVCKKSFNHKHSLRNHLLIHSGEKPFSCKICKSTFTKKEHLKAHWRTHSVDSLNSCDVCNKTFVRRDDLKKHLLIHSGGVSYSCEFCIKTFVRKRNLQQHLRTHSSDRPYSCDVCKRAFRYKHTLQSHVVTHSDGDV